MNNFGDDIASEFLQDARELIAAAEKSLLEVDGGGCLTKHYNSIFRALHSIKGGSGMLGLTRMQQIVHHLETLFSKYKTGKTLPETLTNYLLQGLDAVRLTINNEPETFPIIDPEQVNAPEKQVTTGDRVLALNLDPNATSSLEKLLLTINYRLENFRCSVELKKNIETTSVVVMSCPNRGENAIGVLRDIRASFPDLPVLICCQDIPVQLCIEGLNLRVHSIVQSPVSCEILFAGIHNAIKMHRALQTVEQCVNLLMYQYSDLDDTLNKLGKHTIRTHLQNEMKAILEGQKQLRETKLAG